MTDCSNCPYCGSGRNGTVYSHYSFACGTLVATKQTSTFGYPPYWDASDSGDEVSGTCRFIQKQYEQGYNEAIADVVAWLRSLENRIRVERGVFDCIADAIKRGKHKAFSQAVMNNEKPSE